MKVLVTTGLYPPEIGGPATYSRLLESELPGKGIEVEVLKFSDVRMYPPGVRHLVYAFMVYRRGARFDVLYAMDTASVGWPTYVANIFLRKKFLVRVPGDHAWEQGAQRFGVKELLDDFPLWSVRWPLWLKLIRAMQLRVVRTADVLVVPSNYMAGIAKSWGVDSKKVVTIYNGVHVIDAGKKETIRGMLHFDGLLLISVGRLVPWKGFGILLKVFARLRKKFKNLKLLIVGSGPLSGELTELADSLGLGESVVFTGALEQGVLLRYIRASDVFVLNTSYEGLSHLVLETMAIGVPIVTTSVGGNPEVISDNVNGYLVKPDDMSALESRITTLFEKPEVSKRIVSAGKTRVATFTDESVILKTVELLKSI